MINTTIKFLILKKNLLITIMKMVIYLTERLLFYVLYDCEVLFIIFILLILIRSRIVRIIWTIVRQWLR